MAEKNTQEKTVVEDPKFFTQEQVNDIIDSRFAKIAEKHKAELEAISAEKSELEVQLQERQASQMTASEHIDAMRKRIETLESGIKERDERQALEAQEKLIRGFDDADKQALLESGVNPKYADIVLSQLKESRGIEGDQVFYKDAKGGAVDRSLLIESLKNSNLELFVVNRAKGNNVPHGEGAPSVTPENETTEQYIARKKAEREQAK